VITPIHRSSDLLDPYVFGFLYGSWRRYEAHANRCTYHSTVFDLLLNEQNQRESFPQEDLAWALLTPILHAGAGDMRVVRSLQGKPVVLVSPPHGTPRFGERSAFLEIRRVLQLKSFLTFCCHEEYLRAKSGDERL